MKRLHTYIPLLNKENIVDKYEGLYIKASPFRSIKNMERTW